MNAYESIAIREAKKWGRDMVKKPSYSNKATKGLQTRFNRMIPERIHKLITKAIKNMTRAVLFGAGFTTTNHKFDKDIQKREENVKNRISFYRSSAAAEGAVTGFGGFISGMVDFPLWMALKMKMLFEIASLYGYDTNDLKERIFMLHIFQITFSSQSHRNKIYSIISNWEVEKEKIPDDINEFDWRTFQLEYRDHLDLAKLMQLIPGLGAIVGAYVNHKYTEKLGWFAINAYRTRVFSKKTLKQ